MWDALQETHLDSTAGGRIYWLRKLVLLRLTNDDVDGHIKEMALCAERLNSLITVAKPLTTDDIHAAALLGSLPGDWLHCAPSMMNEENVTSSRIVSALKTESLRLKGHELSACETAARVLKDHQQARRQDNEATCRSDSEKGPNRCEGSSRQTPSRNRHSPQPPAKAGLTTVVELGGDSADESDYSGSECAGNVFTHSDKPAALKATTDFNIDSGCSMSMTTDSTQVLRIKPSSVPIRLADHSMVHATHKGDSSLLLTVRWRPGPR
ncbi:hypothetical protein PTTG_09134 [Puccinia triticina 1-1 BBBD Race 1]|uniref:Uncharacterized protein n=1 Tax=Puccinia triticina (isolate 1-1 / race 1 (BBBD)) TaxID=630390 RepID=A0A0C4F7K1_PUCT1|nr:hypothetical protein PTTG_09134 [Puccinia triticina 1-1 BBBD Race 1]